MHKNLWNKIEDLNTSLVYVIDQLQFVALKLIEGSRPNTIVAHG